jgi:hypothetical protein
LVGLPCFAHEDGLGGVGADLALPDLEVAAVFCNVDGDVFDATEVISCEPFHFVAGDAFAVRAEVGDGKCGHGGGGVQFVADDTGFQRRGVVEDDAGLGADGRTRDRAGGAADGVADAAAQLRGGGLYRGVAGGGQQAAGGVAQYFAGVGVDGLDEPGGDAGLAGSGDVENFSPPKKQLYFWTDSPGSFSIKV